MKRKSELRKLNVLWLILLALAIAVFAESSVEVGETNLTIWDNSDSAVIYDTTRNFFYANYTNATDGSPITGATCNFTFGTTTLSMAYNDTTMLYERSGFTTVGNNTYNISCKKTGYAHLNVTDIVNVTNRNPIQTALLPNVTIAEDSSNTTINLYDYFTDYDNFTGHDENLVWNYTTAENITITINNNTGMLNLTPDADFYGIRNTTITAIDPVNGTNVSNVMFINVTNKPEVNLTSPEDGNQQYYRGDLIIFRAAVEDDFAFENCSLIIDGVLNKTNSSAVYNSVEFKDDDGSAEGNGRTLSNVITSSGFAKNITKQFNVTSPVNTIRIYAYEHDIGGDSDMPPHKVYINDMNVFNISDSDLIFSNSDPQEWIEYELDSNYFVLNTLNNITITKASGTETSSFMRVGIDISVGDEINRSFFNSTYNETGEYLIQLSFVTSFNQTNISKGDHTWNVLCYNNQSQSGTADDDFVISIQDSTPTAPTNITCDGGECKGTVETASGSINISCYGSIDIDGDSFDYILIKQKENGKTVEEELTRFNGTLFEWDVSNQIGNNVTLRCRPEPSPETAYYETGYFLIDAASPPPKLTAENITCNGGWCNNTIFNEDIINITCNASENPDDFSYKVRARYLRYNGTSEHFITDSYASDDSNIISWDTTAIFNQTNVSIWCHVSSSFFETPSDEIENLTLRKANAPTKPSAMIAYEDGEIVRINCSGSTGEGTILYRVAAEYKNGKYKDSIWHLIGTDTDETTYYEWNASQIYEQNATFKCQATNGTYYSELSDANYSMLSHPPSNPAIIVPSSSQNFEYQINYSCEGSSNTEQFVYFIEAIYDNATSTEWSVINNTFAGIIEIEPGSTDAEKIAYDDGDASTRSIINIKENITNGAYQTCIKAKGGGSLALGYNCDGQLITDCDVVNLANQMSSTYQYYCANITLTKTGQKIFRISNPSVGSIDAITFEKLPFTLNVSNAPRQKNVLLRCRAYDSQGYSGYLYSENLTINRIPKFNESKPFPDPNSPLSQENDYRIRWAEGSNLINRFSLRNYFYDEDGDYFNFTSTSSPVSIVINQTTGNVSFYPGNWDGISIVYFYAGDNISNGTSPAITLDVYKTSTGGGGGDDEPRFVEELQVEEEEEEEGEKEEPPVEEEPKPMPQPPEPPKKSKPEIIVSPVIKKVLDTKIKHTREFFLSRSRTKVVERIKNIGFYDLEDTIVRVNFSKAVIGSASEIVMIDQFSVIEEDPLIGFFVSYLGAGDEAELSYIINKRLGVSDLEQITVEIIPKELTEEEIEAKERAVQENINKTSRYVKVKTSHEIEKERTAFTIDLDVEEDAILYNVSIFAEIPKCLAEILKEEMVESDVDFEIIAEDPLIRWHFEKLTGKEEIKYLINKVADENCTNLMNVMPLAHKIMIVEKKVNLANALIPLIIIPAIILIIGFFSAFGVEEKERMREIESLIKWARQTRKRGYSWKGIAESLQRTKRYTREKIRDVIYFGMNTKKLFLTKLDIDIEEGIIIILIILNILDFLKLLPGEMEFAKFIISWTILGYILFHASITRILFGYRLKNIDLWLLLAYFMLIVKNWIGIAETGFIEAGLMKDMYALIVNNNALFEMIFFTGGVFILAALSVYISKRKIISRKSFMGAVGECGTPPGSAFRLISRAFFVLIAELFFFIVVFNLMMEWLAIAVDAALLTAAIFFYLFVMIKHRKKHWAVETLYKIGNIGEKFYEGFVELFHNRKTIFIGITGMITLHILTEIGIFMVPYILGIYNPLYLASWQHGHAPIFNVYGLLRQALGVKGIETASLFMQGATGLGIGHAATLFGMYILNIIAILFLLTIHALVWWHLYKHRKVPVSEVPKMMFSKTTIALFFSSFLAFMLAGAFRLRGLYFQELLGVDIITVNIAQNPNLDVIFAVCITAGLLAYALMRLSPKIRKALNWTMVFVSFVFFIRYIAMFFASVVTFYISTINAFTAKNPFISAMLLVFMTLTIIFYATGILSLFFELWLRDELGLRGVIRVKELPEWMAHFDMSYIHHEKAHKEDKHGTKRETIKQYVLNETKRGHKFSTIIIHLAQVGWSAEAIEEGLAELEKSEEFMEALARPEHKSAKSIASLALHIERELEKGKMLKSLIKEAIGIGWTDADLADSMLILGKK